MAEAPRRETFSEYYQSRRNQALFRWIDRRKVAVLEQAFAPLVETELIVDIGAGSGRIAARLGRPVLCLDKEPALLAQCQERGLRALQADLEGRLPVGDGEAGGVLMIDAIEHVVEPRRVMSEIRRITRPGGVVVLFTPPYDSIPWLLAERFHHFVTRRKADHISPFTGESFEFLVASFFRDYRLGRTNFGLSMYAVIQA